MYVKKEARELFFELDNNLVLPPDFDIFLQKEQTKNYLIIKESKKKFHCNYCNEDFETQEDYKINEQLICSNCNNKYLIKSKKLKSYKFQNDLGVLDKYKDFWIVRYFILITSYRNGETAHFKCEYGRQIYDESFNLWHEIINKNITLNMGQRVFNGTDFFNANWRYPSTYYTILDPYIRLYPGNLQQLLNDKKYKYSMMWKLAEKTDYMPIIELLKNYKPKIEILTKMKLYKLAIEMKTLKKGTFQEKFGLTKDYYQFMKENDISSSELELLRLTGIKDIDFIKKFSYTGIRDLEKYVDVYKVYQKIDLNTSNIFEYADYIKMSRDLNYDLKNKSVLYPKNIKKEHDRVLKLWEVKKDKFINNNIKKRSKKLEKNIYSNKEYIIFPAKTIDDLYNESEQQNNCVKSYAENYSKGKLDIYFMRLKNNQSHSLVTVEVKNKRVVQQRRKNNGVTLNKERKFLNQWEERILNEV